MKVITRIISLLLLLTFLNFLTSCNDIEVSSNKAIEYPSFKTNETGITWPQDVLVKNAESSTKHSSMATAQYLVALPSFLPISDTIDVVYYKDTYGEELLTSITALQGLVNREKPRILIVKDDDIARWTETPDDYEYIECNSKKKIIDLFEKYKNYYDGCVVFETKPLKGDTPNPTVNVATTIAGLKDCLPVGKFILKKLKKIDPNISIVEDLRGKFKTNTEAYQSLYDNYWSDCSKRLLFSLSPNEHLGHIRDMAVATKCAVIWLDPRIEDELNLIEQFVNDMPENKSLIMGWWPDESAGIRIGTQRGIPTVPSDFFENSTIHAGMNHENAMKDKTHGIGRMSFGQIASPLVASDKRHSSIKYNDKTQILENNVYVAITMTEGDNFQCCWTGVLHLNRLILVDGT